MFFYDADDYKYFRVKFKKKEKEKTPTLGDLVNDGPEFFILYETFNFLLSLKN